MNRMSDSHISNRSRLSLTNFWPNTRRHQF
jgi:hypothetical protein